MHLFHFGIYEELLYSYVIHSSKADDGLRNRTAFTQHLLSSADPDGETIGDIAPSDASRYRKGTRAIPEEVVALFQKKSARDMIVEYLEDLVVPFVKWGRKQQLIKEFVNVVEQDTTIDDEFKASVLAEATPERLADFLADLLTYAVGVDPTERDKTYPVENYNLPMSNDWFTGREKELEEIADSFASGCRMQILCGMGGMGKSQIARKYAYNHYRSYSLIHWINANTIDSIVECYRAFLTEKKIAPADETTEAICRSYINYMDSRSDWLLIYDNCDYYTDAEYTEFSNLCLPKNQAVGSILITSRNKRSIGKAKRIEVGVLSDRDAVEFLLQRTWSDDAKGAERLAVRLGRFPLALEIAGAYIHATPGCGFQTYLEYLTQETKILDQMVEVTNYNETIKDILLLTLKRIREDRGGDAISLCVEDAVHLFSYGAPYDIDLRVLACVPFQDDDYEIFIQDALSPENHFEEIRQICADSLQRNELARTLIAYGLMTEQPDGFLSMHELQQEVLSFGVFSDRNWARFLYAAILKDSFERDGAIVLHFYQHEYYITKHWMELSKRLQVPEQTIMNFINLHKKAQTSLAVNRFMYWLNAHNERPENYRQRFFEWAEANYGKNAEFDEEELAECIDFAERFFRKYDANECL